MRYLSVILILAILLVFFGPSHGVTLEATASGCAVYGSPDTLNTNQPFEVNITAHYVPADTTILGWSTPFWFYGTGNVTTLAGGPGTLTADPAFRVVWNIYFYTVQESWDGDLTNSDPGGITGDQMCQWCARTQIFPPYISLPGSGSAVILTFSFDGIVGDQFTAGHFCVDSGDFIDNYYDWLMQPAVAFGPYCWDVVTSILCGDVNSDRAVNMFDIVYLIYFLYMDGPPPCSMELADVDGIEGLNIFDVSHLIAYLYLSGPPPDCP